MLPLERHPVCRLLYRHRRMAAQQIDHHARMRRIEMLDQNERHAGAAREGSEQPPGGIEAASRGAEPDDREVGMAEWRATPRRTPARPRRSRCGLSRTLCCHMRKSTTELCIAATLAFDGARPDEDGAFPSGCFDHPL